MFQAIKGQEIICVTNEDAQYHGYKSEIPKGDPSFVMSRSELWGFFKNAHKWLMSEREKPTGPMEFGSLVDCLLLTPDEFPKRYAVEPEEYAPGKRWNYNATICKDWRTAAEKIGQVAVSTTDVLKAQRAVKSYFGNKRLSDFRAASQSQSMALVEWHDEDTGLVIPFKVMVDLVPKPSSQFGDTLADLKTTNDAEREKWKRKVFSDGLYFQGATYLDAYNTASDLNYRLFENHLIESSAPFEVTHRRISEDFISIGRAHYRAALRNYCQCLKSGRWPGYDTDDVEPESWMVGE